MSAFIDHRTVGHRTKPGTPSSVRFWSKVMGGSYEHCWLWLGGKDPAGYGLFYLRPGSYTKAHRWSYEDVRADIPKGLAIDHLCRNPGCVNPWHLEPVSHRENNLRGMAPGAKALRRDRCIHGHLYELHGVLRTGRRVCRLCRVTYSSAYSALSHSEAERRKSAGVPVVDLAAIFQLSA